MYDDASPGPACLPGGPQSLTSFGFPSAAPVCPQLCIHSCPHAVRYRPLSTPNGPRRSRLPRPPCFMQPLHGAGLHCPTACTCIRLVSPSLEADSARAGHIRCIISQTGHSGGRSAPLPTHSKPPRRGASHLHCRSASTTFGCIGCTASDDRLPCRSAQPSTASVYTANICVSANWRMKGRSRGGKLSTNDSLSSTLRGSVQLGRGWGETCRTQGKLDRKNWTNCPAHLVRSMEAETSVMQ